jgi:hypothetical protein
MQPHQQRVVDEKTELDAKRQKLESFLGGSVYQSLGDEERILLVEQSEVMKCYSDILGRRIALFT